MAQILIVETEDGKLIRQEVVEGNLYEKVKEVALKLIEKWDPSLSDFTVIRGGYELTYKIPVPVDVLDKIQEYGLQVARSGNEAIITLPVYTISYNNEWTGDTYRDRAICIVTYYIDEDAKKQIIDYAVDATSKPKQLAPQLSLTEEELARLEEGLAEAEEAEKPKKRRRRSRRKKSS